MIDIRARNSQFKSAVIRTDSDPPKQASVTADAALDPRDHPAE